MNPSNRREDLLYSAEGYLKKALDEVNTKGCPSHISHLVYAIQDIICLLRYYK